MSSPSPWENVFERAPGDPWRMLAIQDNEIERLKDLLTRAAKALDDVRYADREPGHEELIVELRKAAE